MKKWYKNGAAYNGPKMSAAWYRGNGYSDEAPPEPEAVPEVKRYSKLALHDALGDEAWVAVVGGLNDVQKRRLELAGELSTGDAEFAAVLERLKTQIPDAEAVLAAAEI